MKNLHDLHLTMLNYIVLLNFNKIKVTRLILVHYLVPRIFIYMYLFSLLHIKQIIQEAYYTKIHGVRLPASFRQPLLTEVLIYRETDINKITNFISVNNTKKNRQCI